MMIMMMIVGTRSRPVFYFFSLLSRYNKRIWKRFLSGAGEGGIAPMPLTYPGRRGAHVCGGGVAYAEQIGSSRRASDYIHSHLFRHCQETKQVSKVGKHARTHIFFYGSSGRVWQWLRGVHISVTPMLRSAPHACAHADCPE